jgi:hypothetical protein
MVLEQYRIQEANDQRAAQHRQDLAYLDARIDGIEGIIEKLRAFQIAIPSWALGAGGTRFGRFPIGGEPRSLEEKIEDVALLHRLNRASGTALRVRSRCISPGIFPKMPRPSVPSLRSMAFASTPSTPIPSRTRQGRSRVINSVPCSMPTRPCAGRRSSTIST